MKRILALFLVSLMALCLIACGAEKETTITGMVTAVDGTVISLVEMDGNMGGKNFEEGERPSRPEGMEGFEGFEDGQMPQWGEGEMPELPEGEMPQRPENGERPEIPTGEDSQIPEMPTGEDGEMQWPSFGENVDRRPGSENFEFGGETTQIDIGDAHISVEIDVGKAGGSLEDITPGSFVTLTLNAKGEATNVLVSSRSGFGGMGGFGGKGNRPTEGAEAWQQKDTAKTPTYKSSAL